MRLIVLSFFCLCLVAGDPIEIEGNDRMRFEPGRINIPLGQEVTIVFKNVSRLPGFNHNLVVLKPGTDLDAFGNAALSAQQTQYIPAGMKAQVIAHTPIVKPGQQAEITLQLSEKGVYSFLCTFPGRYSVMQGTINVQ